MTVAEAELHGWAGERAVKFADWRTRIDQALVGLCGMTSDDLPDWDFAQAFEDGMSARDAAQWVLRESGYDN